jgi:hypothetical protein
VLEPPGRGEVSRNDRGPLLDLTYWQQFVSAMIGAGFRSDEMVSWQNALLYAYALVPEHQLQTIIGRWFFFRTLTGRYTGFPESLQHQEARQ